MRRLSKLAVAALLSAAVSVNVLAFLQARAMTRFIEAGERTVLPEQLSLFEKIAVVLSGMSIPRPRNGATPEKYSLPFSTHRVVNPSGEILEAWYVAGRDVSGGR